MRVFREDDERFESDAHPSTRRFYTGLDLGQTGDYSAFSVVKADYADDPEEPELSVVYLERYRGVLYPDVAKKVYGRIMRPPLWGQTDLVVDATGVGRAVTDIYKKFDVPFVGVTITGAKNETQDPSGYWNVPKMTLVAAALLPFQQRRMKVAPKLPLAATLKAELAGFRYKQNPETGHESASHREGEHDDLVLSVSLACWAARRFGGSDVDAGLSESFDPYRPGDELAGIPALDDWWRG